MIYPILKSIQNWHYSESKKMLLWIAKGLVAAHKKSIILTTPFFYKLFGLFIDFRRGQLVTKKQIRAVKQLGVFIRYIVRFGGRWYFSIGVNPRSWFARGIEGLLFYPNDQMATQEFRAFLMDRIDFIYDTKSSKNYIQALKKCAHSILLLLIYSAGNIRTFRELKCGLEVRQFWHGISTFTGVQTTRDQVRATVKTIYEPKIDIDDPNCLNRFEYIWQQ